VVLRVIVLAAVVTTATAAGFVTANSPAATQACRLASVGTLKGHVSMTVNETASGVIPGTKYSEVVSLSRQASNVAIVLKKKKLKIPDWIGYSGYTKGGSFTVADSIAFTESDTNGTLTANGASPQKLGAILAVSLAGGNCGYVLSVRFGIKATFAGSIGLSVSPYVSDFLITPARKVPSSWRLAGNAVVPLELSQCDFRLSPGGCVMYSGGWSNDFTMLKRCNATSAGKCPGERETDLGEAHISWNLSPG
jgi:hypothetical protein